MKKITLLLSAIFVMMMGVQAVNVTGSFQKITDLSSLESGASYVFYGVNGSDAGAMTNTGTTRLGSTEVTFIEGNIVDPSNSIVWIVEGDAINGYTVYNEASSVYAEITGNNTSGFSLSAISSHKYTVSVSSEEFTFVSQHANSGGRAISIYKTDWRPYTAPNELFLYKLDNAAPSTSITIANILPSSFSSSDLGDDINMSAIVTTTDGAIDSVLVAYGETDSTMSTIGKCTVDMSVDSFYYSIPAFTQVDTLYSQFIAFGSNGDKDTTYTITVYGECPMVEAPVAIAATAGDENSFTANWNASTDAAGYLLDVWSEVGTPEVVLVSDGFESGLPLGWSHNSAYFNGGYQYEGSNKAGMNGTTDWVQLSAVDNPSTLSLWHRPSSASADPYSIEVQYGTDGTNWTTLTAFSHENSTGYTEEVIDLTSISTTGLIIRLAMVAKSASFYFDNVEVVSGGLTKNYVLQDDSVMTGTSKLIEGLTAGTTYGYAVSAYNMYGCESEMSNDTTYLIPVVTSIAPLQEAVAKVFATHGAITINSVDLQQVVIYDITGRQVAKQMVNGEASISIKRGIYLVKVAEQVTKVAVQ